MKRKKSKLFGVIGIFIILVSMLVAIILNKHKTQTIKHPKIIKKTRNNRKNTLKSWNGEKKKNL